VTDDITRARARRYAQGKTPEQIADELKSLRGICPIPTCQQPLDAHNTAQIIRCAAARPKQGA
jgi:hypothetical protein